eukprot:3549799-Pleurochrysis_carterae.AAC.1
MGGERGREQTREKERERSSESSSSHKNRRGGLAGRQARANDQATGSTGENRERRKIAGQAVTACA